MILAWTALRSRIKVPFRKTSKSYQGCLDESNGKNTSEKIQIYDVIKSFIKNPSSLFLWCLIRFYQKFIAKNSQESHITIIENYNKKKYTKIHLTWKTIQYFTNIWIA